jgi:hypothetical protein
MNKGLKLWGFQGNLTGQEGAYFYRLPILETAESQYFLAQADDWTLVKNLVEVAAPAGTAVKLDLMCEPGEVINLVGPGMRADLAALEIPISGYWLILPDGFAILSRRLSVMALVVAALNSRAVAVFDHEWRFESQPSEMFERALRVLTGNMAFPERENLLRQLVATRLRRGQIEGGLLTKSAALLACDVDELGQACEKLYIQLSDSAKRR